MYVRARADASHVFHNPTLGNIVGEINKLIDVYGNDAELALDAGHENICIDLDYKRLETDAEFARRLKKEERLEDEQKQESVRKRDQEIATLKRLQKKYGNIE